MSLVIEGQEMIRIRGLHKSYGDHAVLRGIDFDVLKSMPRRTA